MRCGCWARRSRGWRTPVTTCSALTGAGLDEVWQLVTDHQRALRDSGFLARRRNDQQVAWMWSMVRDRLTDRLREDPALRELTPTLEAHVRSGQLTAVLAADRLLGALLPGTPDR